MDEKHLRKLQRISETTKALSLSAQKSERAQLHTYKDFYETQYELIRPILYDSLDYQLEFQSLKKPGQVNNLEIVPALINISTFVDTVIKEETLDSRQKVTLFENEYFIDENKPLTAYNKISSILNQSVTSLKIVDNYIESSSLEFFLSVNTQANIQVISKRLLPNNVGFKVALSKFALQWGGVNFQVKTSNYFHDRFLIVDDIQVWHLGPSLNYLGKRPMMISMIQDEQIRDHVITLFNEEWKRANSI